MSQIFINYRRQDSQYAAGRIADHLISHFGEDRVFIDVDTIKPGLDFLEVIETVIGETGVIVSIIGPSWAKLTDREGRQRLSDPQDPVRMELEMGLKSDLPILPVLVEGAKMPPASDLPDELGPVSRRHALEVAHERFRKDASDLISEVEKVVGPPVEESAQGEKPVGRVLAALGATARESSSIGFGGTLRLLSNAGLAAGITAAFMFALAMVVAIQTPAVAAFDLSGGDASQVKEAFNQVSGFTLADMRGVEGGDATFRTTPGIFALLFIAASLLSSFLVAGRTKDLPTRNRLIWGAGMGLPLGVIMVVLGALAGTTQVDTGESAIGQLFLGSGITSFEPSPGQVFAYALLWGAIGGTIGTRAALRREGKVGKISGLKWATGVRGVAWSALRPLALLLLVTAIAGTSVWVVQTMRDAGGIGESTGRSSTAVAIENGLYLSEHSLNFAALGSLATFAPPETFRARGLAAPVTKVEEVVGAPPEDASNREIERFEPSSYNLLDYKDALTATMFVPALGLILVVVLFAADAGFSVARNRAVARPEEGFAWGLIVGPVWAVVMVALNVVLHKKIGGDAQSSSVVVGFLVAGAIGGSLGGILSATRHPAANS